MSNNKNDKAASLRENHSRFLATLGVVPGEDIPSKIMNDSELAALCEYAVACANLMPAVLEEHAAMRDRLWELEEISMDKRGRLIWQGSGEAVAKGI